MSTQAILPTSPGYNRDAIADRNSLRELDWIGKLNIRGNMQNENFAAAVGSVLNGELPVNANTQTRTDAGRVFWLGPDEWLLHCDIGQTGKLSKRLVSALQGLHSAVVEVSDYYTVLRLDGPDAARLLARGCPLDLHASVFAVGDCAQTKFGHASVLLHRRDGPPCFDIQVRWSYMEYVWDYIVSAMNCLDTGS